ncbi:MAG: polysaccharide deacetylase family protein [Nitrospiraceae bacterium]|nr:polysaccharide deacetylase family protein [Nitrospiraceae bacterium]
MIRQVLLSLDVEEFDIPEEYGQLVGPDDRIRVSSEGLVRVLDLLDRLDISCTCYTTVHFAREQGDLLSRMAARHEIASHGLSHSGFSPGDLLRSRTELEALTGGEVRGFRMPRFGKIDSREVLAAGYRYNSSENPIWLPGRYMHLFSPRLPYFTGDLLNLPISASPVIRYPFFWLSFKNSPLWLFRAMTRWTLRTDGYLNIFFHPWEFSDLSDWRLPFYVRRLSGDKMLGKLGRYLTWLKGHAVFITSADFAGAYKTWSREEGGRTRKTSH